MTHYPPPPGMPPRLAPPAPEGTPPPGGLPAQAGAPVPDGVPWPRRRRSVLPPVIAWVVVALVTAFIFGMVFIHPYTPPAAQEANTELASAARMRIGLVELFGTQGKTMVGPLSALDAQAKTPRDRLHVAIIAGETDGPAQAIARLQTLAHGKGVVASDPAGATQPATATRPAAALTRPQTTRPQTTRPAAPPPATPPPATSHPAVIHGARASVASVASVAVNDAHASDTVGAGAGEGAGARAGAATGTSAARSGKAAQAVNAGAGVKLGTAPDTAPGTESGTKSAAAGHAPETDPGVQQEAALLLPVYRDDAALSPSARARVLASNRWYGQAAVTYGQPDDPLRRDFLATARAATIAMVAALGGVVTLGVLGVGLFITGLVLFSTGRLAMALRTEPADAGVYIEGFAIFLVGFVGLSIAAEVLRIDRFGSFFRYVLLLAVVAAAAVWPLVRGVGAGAWRRALGLNTGRGIAREIAMGVVGYVGCIPVIGLAFILTAVLGRLSHTTFSHPLVGQDRSSMGGIVQLFLLASLFAPVTEELMFRGLLVRHLRGGMGWLAAAVVSGVLFASIHPQGWVALPVLAGVGGVLAFIRQWRGSIVPSIVAHALHNGMLVAMLVLFTRGGLA